MGSTRMRGPRLVAFAVVFAGIAACGDSLTDGTTSDANAPALDLAGSVSTVDTVLAFAADARDNLGLKTVHVSVSGGVAFTFDTTFTSAVTSTTIPFTLSVPRSVPAGTSVTVVGSWNVNSLLPVEVRTGLSSYWVSTVAVLVPGSPLVSGAL